MLLWSLSQTEKRLSSSESDDTRAQTHNSSLPLSFTFVASKSTDWLTDWTFNTTVCDIKVSVTLLLIFKWDYIKYRKMTVIMAPRLCEHMCNATSASLARSWLLLKGLTCWAPAAFLECAEWTTCFFLSNDHQFVVSKASRLLASPSLSGWLSTTCQPHYALLWICMSSLLFTLSVAWKENCN